ncbi:hypothetical protein TrCOL_g10956 [Triparma columacea]|uniref:Uncharacterized protein n=1 Tax=Triparma columacea TaxID=722753 RepID=A0A9W7LC13_9STRA|nr:hypothetical protein TrCOL_g10956 [Triparma columacea]
MTSILIIKSYNQTTPDDAQDIAFFAPPRIITITPLVTPYYLETIEEDYVVSWIGGNKGERTATGEEMGMRGEAATGEETVVGNGFRGNSGAGTRGGEWRNGYRKGDGYGKGF